jgi:signal transduction histidine kinase
MSERGTRHGSFTFLAGGGEMGERCRAYDWAETPLGPVADWPQSLRSAVSILLPSKAQIVLFWGPQYVAIYNDAYRPVFGSRHPRALGKPGAEAWDVIWSKLGPLLDGVVRTGDAFWARDLGFFLDRAGFLEETYFDVSYDPVRDETGSVGGVFCIVSETTPRVLGERRLRTLRDLGAQATTVHDSVAGACRAVIATVEENALDVPFGLVYLAGADGWSLGAATGRAEAHLQDAGLLGPDAWPLDEVSASRTPRTVTGLALPRLTLPGLPTDYTPARAVVLPLATSDLTRVQGALVVGVSPVLALDEVYGAFFRLLAQHVATAMANATAYLEERRRAEALVKLDQAKTAFFSNVSHEFRTPLTLMLGPVDELLSGRGGELSPAASEQLAVVSRNGLRLLRLVNTLLDFSRIEAGRVRAAYEPTDLAALTADLASGFRAAVERAGLRLVVDCPPLTTPVFATSACRT